MSQLTERSGRIFYFFFKKTSDDFVLFRSTPDANCGKENRKLYGDFWNPSICLFLAVLSSPSV
jgi:hypothetical protein